MTKWISDWKENPAWLPRSSACDRLRLVRVLDQLAPIASSRFARSIPVPAPGDAARRAPSRACR
jgi:hypothetical protein